MGGGDTDLCRADPRSMGGTSEDGLGREQEAHIVEGEVEGSNTS